ncbi:hypothetical protein SUDANB121_03795 [Nocardiopsis dassonvillei]|uniref:hypothetical protein n=1 Tax=Nocardiopsis dassonvillei TaxID=2014 RepID=UPI003F55B3BE
MTRTADRLPDPEALWAFAAAEAAVAAGMGSFWPEGRRIAEDGSLFMEDGGGNWFRLVRVEGDRFLLVGWDRSGDTTNPYRRPTNLFAQAPAWLPWEWIGRAEERGVLGFAYWWDGEAWARSAYPEGVEADGVRVHTDPYLDAEHAARRIGSLLEEGHLAELEEWEDAEQEEFDAFHARVEELVAAVGRRSVTGADLGFLEDIPFDTEAAMTVLRRAGVAAGVPREAVPVSAGTEVPADRLRVRRLSGREWALLVEPVMRASAERERPVPPDSEPLRRLTDALRGLAADHGGEVTYTVSIGERSASPSLVDADGSRVDGFRFPSDFELHRAEAHPEHGRWFFLRVRATPESAEVDRAYDHWPGWAGERFAVGGGVPIGDVAAEMARRDPAWRPDWVWLLDEEVVYDPPADPFTPPGR